MKKLFWGILLAALSTVLFLAGCAAPGGGGGGGIDVLQGTTPIVSGGAYDFGSVALGISGTPVPFTIRNNTASSVSLPAGSLTVSGAGASDFAVTASPGTTIAAGDSTTFTLVYSPAHIGARNVLLSLTLPDGSYTFSLTGAATGSSGTATFQYDGDGWLNIGANGASHQPNLPYLYGPGSSMQNFRITNTSLTEKLYLAAGNPVTLSAVTPTDAFSTTQPPDDPILPGSYAEFVITMNYVGYGSYEDTATIYTSDPSYPAFTFSVTGSQC
jgi:hypothetical protein